MTLGLAQKVGVCWPPHLSLLFFLHLQKATISHVSPDSLYLFRVQAVCRNDMRSDFSQTMLFQGKAGSLSLPLALGLSGSGAGRQNTSQAQECVGL